MKKLLLAILAVVLFSTIDAEAGIATKKHKATVEVVATSGNTSGKTVPVHATKAMKRRAIMERVANIFKHDSDAIPKPLYVVLAIIALGWLAMGINDNFEGWHWVISLLLYILGWLPGVIYTLIMMKDYY